MLDNFHTKERLFCETIFYFNKNNLTNKLISLLKIDIFTFRIKFCGFFGFKLTARSIRGLKLNFLNLTNLSNKLGLRDGIQINGQPSNSSFTIVKNLDSPILVKISSLMHD